MKAADFKPLTNRSADAAKGFALPADGFVQLVPLGSAPNIRGNGDRVIQLVDAQALEAMLTHLLNRGGEMLIDYEHFSHDRDKGTDAAAWLPCDAEHLENRADGLYGKPRWSAPGLADVEGGRLRFISPEFPDEDALLQPVSGKVLRPLAVTGFGLTNRPGFRRDAKPLTNSGRPTRSADNPDTKNMHKALLALALGLPETELDQLDENALRQKVQDMKQQLLAAEEAAKKQKQQEEADATAFMNRHKDLKPLANKAVADHLRATFLTNRELAQAIVDGWRDDDDGMTDAERARAERKPLHNRQSSEVKPTAAADAAAERRAKAINARASAILANREEPTWAAAFQRATEEVDAQQA